MLAKRRVWLVLLALGIVIAGSLLALSILPRQPSPKFYASPNGHGDGRTASTPFKIVDFWEVAQPGATLFLLDGEYTGLDSMINPPSEMGEDGCARIGGGTSKKPITVRALHDGEVLLNGQAKEIPVLIRCQAYLVIEGINASNSSGDVYAIGFSHHISIKRAIGWDAADANSHIFAIHYSDHTLFEDVAGWGIARKVFSSSQEGNYTTIRRSWGRWEGSHYLGPKMTYTLAYNNHHMIVENAIGTFSGEKMQNEYTILCSKYVDHERCGQRTTGVDQPYGIFSLDKVDTPDAAAYAKLLGSLAYIRGSDDFAGDYLVRLAKADQFEVTDVVAYIEPGSYGDVQPFFLSTGIVAHNLKATRLTAIGGAESTLLSDWKPDNVVVATDLVDLLDHDASIFGSGKGANLCFRYEDGKRTKKPLWPWPMDQRISDALQMSGRDPLVITQVVESMFGPIPASCTSAR